MLNSFKHAGRYVSVAASALIILGTAQADVVMKLDGIDVPATNMSFSVSRQAVVDLETFVPVTPALSTLTAGSIYITRSFDGSSAKVIKHVIDGASVGKFEVTVSDGAEPTSRTVWALTNAVINNYSTYMDEQNQLIESFDVSYDTASLSIYSGDAASPKESVSWKASPADAVQGH